MNTFRFVPILLFLSFVVVSQGRLEAQIMPTGIIVPTEYSSGAQDNIHVFCGEKGILEASLIASYPQGETGNFEWQKYNTTTGTFDFFSSDQSGNQTSSISGLADGCYRVKINTLSGLKTYTAWVFNNYIEAKAEITDSNCSSLTLHGTFDSPDFLYVDLNTRQVLTLKKDLNVSWKDGDALLGNYATLIKSDPPTKNTVYTFVVFDKFGCSAEANVEYTSIVTKASFDYKIEGQGPGKDKRSDPSKYEAPLTVSFTNNSENATSFEWYFYKSLDVIKKEKDAGTFKDSIQEVVYNRDPVYTYEASGEYLVKLVAKRTTESITCSDYSYIDDYIKVDTSFIDAPNVFTPNGDGKNDNFAIKYFSMKTIKFTILNRWGKVLHTWESGNVQGFYNSATSISAAVWDGKVGGRMATPGVYFWVAEGIGRDGVRRKENGFFHLFRDK